MADRHDYEPAHGSRLPEPGRRTTYGGGDGLEHQSTPELLKEMMTQGKVLLRHEVQLAKLEAKEEARKVAKAGAGFGAGAALLYTGLLVFAAFLVAVGWAFLPLWLSALIVAVLFMAAGAGAALWGKKKMDHLDPARPTRGLKEEGEWLSDTMKNAKSRRHMHA